jgi:endonuclease/exonuclease/phosphatase family metal-dependent hydrolase
VPARLTIASWNLERCKYIPQSATILAAGRADIALLTEMDIGMARSGNRHTTRDLSARLGMGYAYGTEFIELGLGDDREQAWHAGAANEAGLHGNAIASRLAIERPAVIPLDPGGEWFRADGQPDQRRIGGRMAVAATFSMAGGKLACAAVHFESRLGPQDRAAEMAILLDRIEAYAGGLPIVLGGDFNTAAMPTGAARLPEALENPARFEPMFVCLADAGFDWRAANEATPTLRMRPDGTPPPPYNKIDWFFTRGVSVSHPRTVAALDEKGDAVSDHECLTLEVGL